jgi:hypothetical protein
MKIVRGFALAFLSLILFLSLCAFGIAYTVNQAALDPHDIEKAIDNINFSKIVQEQIDKQNTNGDMSPEMEAAIVSTVQNDEPVLKRQLDISIEQTYAYLKERDSIPDLKQTLSNSVMTSAFVSDLLDKIDLSQILDRAMQQPAESGTDYSAAFVTALVNAVHENEPALKTQITNASDPIFKYLLMQTPGLDLKSTLRQTILSDSTVSEVLNNLDYTTMTKNIVMEYIGGPLAEGITLSDAQIDQVVDALQPSIKTAFSDAAGTFADYLTGTNLNFSLEMLFAPALQTLRTVAKQAFFAQLPKVFQGESQAELDSAFEQFYTNLVGSIPTTYEVNSSDIGISTAADIASAIDNAQKSLTTARDNIDTASRDYATDLQNARPYVRDFQIGFICLIVLIVLLISGIILICRNVKNSCRDLGIVFLIYGAFELAGVLIAKHIATAQIAKANISQSLNNIPGMILRDFTSPLQTISLVCLIGGIVLLVVSIIYPKLKSAKSTEQISRST